MKPSISIDQIQTLREEHIGRLFLRAHRAFSEMAFVQLRDRGHDGLSIVHTNVLAHLDMDGTAISTLAERAGMTKQSMREIVVDLEEKGYVTASAHPTDKRVRLIHFTDEGWRFLRDAYEVKLAIEQAYTAILGEEKMHQLRSSLERLLNEHTTGS